MTTYGDSNMDEPMAVRVKICGLTSVEDALAAARLGADALGFVMAPSPRQVTVEKAQAIIRELPPLVQTVGVFVDEQPEKVEHAARLCGFDLLQFHGSESALYCSRFGRRVIKAFRLRSPLDLEGLAAYCGVVDAFLLDTFLPGKHGGTGLTFDWNLALEAKKYGRVILAGGLNADNVSRAIRATRPYAVDASSGLERAPGIKDSGKVALFVERATRAATSED